MDRNTEETRTGRPPLPDIARKDTMYYFRVNALEKRVLDALGEPYQWRNFCVLVAMSYLGLEQAEGEGIDFEGTYKTIEDVNLGRLFLDVLEGKFGRKDTDEGESEDSEEG